MRSVDESKVHNLKTETVNLFNFRLYLIYIILSQRRVMGQRLHHDLQILQKCVLALITNQICEPIYLYLRGRGSRRWKTCENKSCVTGSENQK